MRRRRNQLPIPRQAIRRIAQPLFLHYDPKSRKLPARLSENSLDLVRREYAVVIANAALHHALVPALSPVARFQPDPGAAHPNEVAEEANPMDCGGSRHLDSALPDSDARQLRVASGSTRSTFPTGESKA